MNRHRSLARRLVRLAACGFGAGAAPVAPGTFGTLVAVPLYLVLAPLGAWAYAAAVGVLFVVGIALCAAAEEDLGVHDHPSIVWDEITGFLVTMFLAPPGWGWIVAGFLLFRLFDVWKPWPIRAVERRVRGGLGSMLDDLLAGFAACGALQLAAAFL
jgi:phosphatidylglycerophosphatase A